MKNKSEKNIFIAFILNLLFSIFEFIGGTITNSVAIISDSIHDIGDSLSIGISWFLEKNIILMEKVFEKLPKLKLNSRKLQLFLNGVMLTYNVEDGVYNIYDDNNNYIGTGIVKGELLKRDIII